MLQHLTLLAHGADTGLVTRALAASIVTGEVRGTLVMSSALYLAVRTGQHALLVHYQAVLAFAYWLVIGDNALLVEVTRCASTWIKTLPVLTIASSSKRTVFVAFAAGWLDNLGLGWEGVTRGIWATSHMWAANMTLWTLTSWLVNADSTNSIYSTSRSKTTRIYAFAFFARLARRTIKVRSAFAF